MPVINCLETALKKYGDKLNHDDIKGMYESLIKESERLQKEGADVLAKLNQYAENQIKSVKRAMLARELQALRRMQAVTNTLQAVHEFNKEGYGQNSVINGIQSRLVGTKYRVQGARDNSYSRSIQFRDDFEGDLDRFLTENNLHPIYLSKGNQVDLAEAMLAAINDKPFDTPIGKLAKFFVEQQRKQLNNFRAQGVDIHARDDRIAPNIHDAATILKLSLAEKREAKSQGLSDYEFAFNRWNDFILDRINKDEVFAKRGIDVNDRDAIKEFQINAFDHLVNKGKSSTRGMNYANKLQAERIYHWKDAKSLVEYNEKYGSGTLQDSITRELSSGASKLAVIQDWGVEPFKTLDQTFDMLDKHPDYRMRANKDKERAKVRRWMESTLGLDGIDNNSTIANLETGLRTWEVITKLGNSMLRSTPDLRNTMKVAAEMGQNRFVTLGKVLKRFTVGLNKQEKVIFARYVHSAVKSKIGQITRYYVNPFQAKSIGARGLHYMYKLNLLGRWDNANRGTVVERAASMLAQGKNTPFEKVSKENREIFSLYNIGENEWDVMRQSAAKAGANGKLYITPELVQDVPNDVIEAALKKEGVKDINPLRIQAYKDTVERKFTTYFRDRQDFAINNPDAIDRDFLSFGIPKDRVLARSALRIATQFKSFGLAFWRRAVLTTLFDKGARNYTEALNMFSGRSNWLGITRMAIEIGVLTYIGDTLINLSLGLSPPSLKKPAEYERMLKNMLGVFDIALDINFKDPVRTLGQFVAGPGISDAFKVGQLGIYELQELKKHDPKTVKAINRLKYNIARSNIPFNTFATKWMWNHLFLDQWEDEVSPGKRRRDLNKIKENTGAQKLF